LEDIILILYQCKRNYTHIIFFLNIINKKRSRQYRNCLKIGLVENKRFCSSTSADPSSAESIEEISRREDSYTVNSFLEGLSMDILIKKANYFYYSTGEIRKHVNQGKGYDKERFPATTREPKCSLFKEFILYYAMRARELRFLIF
jgi:hypothetical protein